MERLDRYREILNCLPQPALLVGDGKILLQNKAAAAACDAVEPLLREGLPEPPVVIASGEWNVTVRGLDDLRLLLVEKAKERPAAAGAVSTLRVPLSEVFSTAGLLMPSLEEDPVLQKQAAKLNRGLYRLYRAISNMDLFGAEDVTPRISRIDLCALLGRLGDAVPNPCTETGVTLSVVLPDRPIYISADPQLLERAVLNLLSNAFRHAAPESCVTLTVQRQRSRAVVTVRNTGVPAEPSSIFGGSEASMMQGTAGVGLELVRLIARLLHGTVLFQIMEDGTAVTLAFPLESFGDGVLRSPVIAHDYAGGFSHVLLELSDVLPWEAFLPMAID